MVLKEWSWTSSFTIIWEYIRNANSWVRPRPIESKSPAICVLTRPPSDPKASSSVRTTDLSHVYFPVINHDWYTHTFSIMCCFFYNIKNIKYWISCRKFGKIQKVWVRKKISQIPLLRVNCVNFSVFLFQSSLGVHIYVCSYITGLFCICFLFIHRYIRNISLCH